MENLDELMFKQEHFPLRLVPGTISQGKQFYEFNSITIPPYHPILEKNEIDANLAISVLDESLNNIIQELKEVADRKEDIKQILTSIQYEEDKVVYGKPKEVFSGKLINPFPVIGMLFIGDRDINPRGKYYNHFISICPRMVKEKYFKIPKEIKFSQALMQEYEMRIEEETKNGYQIIHCPNIWHSDNLNSLERIVYKNIVMALDNIIVKKKYGGK